MVQPIRFILSHCQGFETTRRVLLGLVLVASLAVPIIAWSQTGGGNGGTSGSGSAPRLCAKCDPGDPPTLPALDAAFVSQSVPAAMSAGQRYAVTVTLRNTGSKTWTAVENFRLGSQNPVDNTVWGLGRVDVPASVAKGQNATFNFNVTAPQVSGSYNFQWRMVQDGVAWFGASATNVAVAVSSSNTPPTVQLTSPANNGSASAPASISLTATAADSGGSVVSVSFWSGANLLGTDASAPFSMALVNILAGTYQYKAIATDNAGAATTSATVNFTVAAVPLASASAVRTYVYDTYERLCKTINPESGATLLDYDAAGNVSWVAEGTALLTAECDRFRVMEVQKTYRQYDQLNRVRQVVTPGGTADLATTYYPDGQVQSLQAKNPGNLTVTTTYNYNKRRLLTNETSGNGSTVYSLGYGHDANGTLATLTYPDGQTVSYLPDALGRATRVASTSGANYASEIRYFASGAIRQFKFGNEIVHSMEPNLRNLPARSLDRYVGSTSTLTVLDDSYAFDQNANVKSIIDAAQAGLTSRTMTYDGVDRLKSAVSPLQWGNAVYGYDALDNLRVADQGARQYRYNYDAANRLSSISSPGGSTIFTLGYDPRGNTTSKNGQPYVFDSVNRMSQVTGLQTYRYDGQGRRVQTTDSDGKTTFWIYSQSGQVLYTSEARRSQNVSYIYLGNSQVATRSVTWAGGAVSVRYQHTDALGSPVAETDPLRNIIKRNSYAPYGEAYGATVIDGTGYTGHVMDRATGLTYMQQRYYDPQIGRFLSVDPMASDTNNGWNFNRYNYAANNSYKFKDPDGRVANFAIKAVVDFGLEVGIQYATTGTVNLGVAAIETGKGMLNPMKTVERVKDLGRLAKAAVRASKSEKHHVVPHKDGRAAAARDQMRANGIEPKTDKSNLVDIPGDKHDVTKRDSYVRDTNDRISAQPDAESIRVECCKIADNLRNASTDELKQQYPTK